MKEIASTCAMKMEHPKFPGNRNGLTEPHDAMSNGKNQWIRSRRIFRTDETSKSKTRQEA
jgi:hypothetical protein